MVLVEDECRIEREAGTSAVWFPRGETVTVKVDQQKEAVSFYGCLNVKTGDCHYLSTQGTQNSVVTVRFLKTLEERYRGKNVILPLPPYSPELNLQEHVWRKGRQLVTHNSEDDFSDRIRKFANFLINNKFKTNFLKKYTKRKYVRRKYIKV